MPNKDGSLTGADTITMRHALDRMIPTPSDKAELSAGTLGLLPLVQQRTENDASSQSAFLRTVEALSLDLMAHAVGGFAALTAEEQIASLHNVEAALPQEFNLFLQLVRDVYYEDERTPDRPVNFDGENEAFGKVVVDVPPAQDLTQRRRRNRRN
jgi:hypothetical protein